MYANHYRPLEKPSSKIALEFLRKKHIIFGQGLDFLILLPGKSRINLGKAKETTGENKKT